MEDERSLDGFLDVIDYLVWLPLRMSHRGAGIILDMYGSPYQMTKTLS